MKSHVVLGTLSLTCVLLGVGVLLGLAPAMNLYVRHRVAVTGPGSEGHDLWANPTHPTDQRKWGNGSKTTLTVYFFNITNAEDAKGGQFPALKLAGPYVYRQYRSKSNVTWNSDKSQVTFTYRKYHVLEHGKVEENVTLPSLPVFGALDKVRWQPDLAELAEMGIRALKAQNITVEPYNATPVADVMWGYEDRLLHMLAQYGLAPTSEVKLFLNDTGDGIFSKPSTVRTGNNEYVKWAGYSTIPWWDTTEAREIAGTDGYRFHTSVSTSDSLLVFDDMAYRSMELIYDRDTYVSGIKTLRFVLDPAVMQDASQNPINSGYDSYLPGLINFTGIPIGPFYDAPAFYSAPFFAGSPQWFRDRVHLPPIPSGNLQTYIDVEPITGFTLAASKQYQLNVLQQPAPGLSVGTTLQYCFLPVIWGEERTVVDPKVLSKVKSFLSERSAAMAVGYGIGALLVVAGLVCGALALRAVATPTHRSAVAHTQQEEASHLL